MTPELKKLRDQEAENLRLREALEYYAEFANEYEWISRKAKEVLRATPKPEVSGGVTSGDPSEGEK